VPPVACLAGVDAKRGLRHDGVDRQINRPTTRPEDYVESFVSRFPDVEVRRRSRPCLKCGSYLNVLVRDHCASW